MSFLCVSLALFFTLIILYFYYAQCVENHRYHPFLIFVHWCIVFHISAAVLPSRGKSKGVYHTGMREDAKGALHRVK